MIRKGKIFLTLFCGVVILASCSSTSKVNYSPDKIDALDQLISERNFKLEADWALPLTSMSLQNVFNALLPIGINSSRIDLIGNPNYLRIMGDSITAHLPYYGERQMGGGYNSRESGIKFEAVPNDLEVNYNKDKLQYEIKFSANQDTESYNIGLIIYPNLTGILNINSTQRFSITYEGKIKKIEE